jgi:hypothetical protein
MLRVFSTARLSLPAPGRLRPPSPKRCFATCSASSAPSSAVNRLGLASVVALGVVSYTLIKVDSNMFY